MGAHTMHDAFGCPITSKKPGPYNFRKFFNMANVSNAFFRIFWPFDEQNSGIGSM